MFKRGELKLYQTKACNHTFFVEYEIPENDTKYVNDDVYMTLPYNRHIPISVVVLTIEHTTDDVKMFYQCMHSV